MADHENDRPDVPGRWPPPRVEPDARALIREAHRRVRRRIAVLDDDPTGSQTVHDVTIVTGFAPEDYRPALTSPGATCFVLTNTRSMDAPQAAALNHDLGRGIFAVGDELDGPVQIVSRSDSTLRGHLSRRSTPSAPPERSTPAAATTEF